MRFLSDRDAASATEFAVIAPILAFMMLGIIDGWSLATTVLGARSAAQSAARYFIGGGASTISARTIALSAWKHPPADADLTVSQSCFCDGVASVCAGIVCASTSMPPVAYININATGTWTAPFSVRFLSGQMTVSQTQVVRVR